MGESKALSSKEKFEQSDMEKSCILSDISTQDAAIVLEPQKRESKVLDADSGWVKNTKGSLGRKQASFNGLKIRKLV